MGINKSNDETVSLFARSVGIRASPARFVLCFSQMPICRPSSQDLGSIVNLGLNGAPLLVILARKERGLIPAVYTETSY